MLVPLKWLREYTEVTVEPKELSDKMTMSGSKVEEIRQWGDKLDKLVIGRIEKIFPHPDADKLVIAYVNVGKTDRLQIVTGAPNIREGNLIPVALEGTELPNGKTIVKEELRGQESQGMMCSHDELGVPKHLVPEDMKTGIWILDEGEPGDLFIHTLPLVEEVVEFEITSNRPDCLSMIGMARETAATLNTSLKLPDIQLKEEGTNWLGEGSVRIEDQEGCQRYVARRIENITVRQSPQWMQLRLIHAGVRPINNVVDVTNYVMLETGQPLHAFDAHHVAGQSIIVRRAEPGEITKTLDGMERTLNESMTLITDTDRVLGIAGVMGGEHSEVTSRTQTIILESACFTAERIRKTSQQLGLRTEASSRFEKGQDPELCLMAANRACQLLEELEAGIVSPGVIDVYPNRSVSRQREVRPDRVNGLLGTEMSADEMVEFLNRLEIKATYDGSLIQVTVPTFRADLEQEADFIEEIGRLYGFDNIKPTLMRGDVMVGGLSHRQKLEELLKLTLSAAGCHEAATYSFVSPSSADAICLPQNSFKREFVKLLNPLGDETSVMRTTLMPNMLDILQRNIHRTVAAGRFYEIGQVFYTMENEKQVLPLETTELVIGLYGNQEDYYTVKGIVIHLCHRLGINDVFFEREPNHPTFHPGRCTAVYAKDRLLGTIGEVHPVVRENYELGLERAVLAELSADALFELSMVEPLYQPLPRYPAIIRDLAVVVAQDLPAGSIEEVIRNNGSELLESCTLFDVYQGAQVGEGMKSVAYTLTFRHPERTLKDKEVNQVYDAIVRQLKAALNASTRA